MYNPIDGGLFGNKLKYKRSKSKKHQQAVDEATNGIEEININPEDDVALLKHTLVNNDNMDLIKEKIGSTAKFRKNMLKDKNLDLLQNFPYLYTNPELVCFQN